MELITTDAVKRWRETLGPTDSAVARDEAPGSVRAKFGKDKQANAAHGSDSDISATRVSLYFSILSLQYYGMLRLNYDYFIAFFDVLLYTYIFFKYAHI